MKHRYSAVFPASAISVLVFFGCGGASKKVDTGFVREDGEVEDVEISKIILHAEAYSQLDPRLRGFLSNPDPAVRARLAEALGRIRSLESIPMLVELLHDKESAVRESAAFAAGQMPQGAVSGPLVKALASWKRTDIDEKEHIAFIDALSRLEKEFNAVRVIGRDLKDSRASIRAAAARGLGRLGLLGKEHSNAVRNLLCENLADSDPETRMEKAAALSRVSVSGLPAPCIFALRHMLKTDPSAEARIQAARAVVPGRSPDAATLEIALSDADYRVAANALTSLSASDMETRCSLSGVAVLRLSQDLKDRPELRDTPFLHVVHTALEVAISSCSSFKNIADAAAEIAAQMNADEKAENRGAVRVACLASVVSGRDDIEILGCDPRDSRLGKETLIAKMKSSPQTEETREALLALLKDSDPAAAVDALHAIAAEKDDRAIRTVVETLADERPLLQIAALREIQDNPALYRIRDAAGGELKTLPEVGEAFVQILHRYQEFEHAFMPLQSLAAAAGAEGDESAASLLIDLLRDTRLPVRQAAEEAFFKMPHLVPPPGLPPLQAPDELKQALESVSSPSDPTAVIQFSKGDLVATLFNTSARLTVAGFLQLAKSGYYDKSIVYRTVQGEAVFLGDPTGTGIGDPGWFTPLEPAPLIVEKGSLVVMHSDEAVGTGRFFIALRRMPELDGAATVLGRITSGFDILDQLAEGDEIIKVFVTEDK